jgi:hypothetical protein
VFVCDHLAREQDRKCTRKIGRSSEYLRGCHILGNSVFFRMEILNNCTISQESISIEDFKFEIDASDHVTKVNLSTCNIFLAHAFMTSAT